MSFLQPRGSFLPVFESRAFSGLRKSSEMEEARASGQQGWWAVRLVHRPFLFCCELQFPWVHIKAQDRGQTSSQREQNSDEQGKKEENRGNGARRNMVVGAEQKEQGGKDEKTEVEKGLVKFQRKHSQGNGRDWEHV
ncbi:hypothetical protein STEG23_006969 [Scotinomys teguina]